MLKDLGRAQWAQGSGGGGALGHACKTDGKLKMWVLFFFFFDHYLVQHDFC